MDIDGAINRSLKDYIDIEIDPSFLPYTAAAKIRFLVVYPSCSISILGDDVRISKDQGLDNLQIAKEFRHCLYREKIYQETLDMRRGIVRALVEK